MAMIPKQAHQINQYKNLPPSPTRGYDLDLIAQQYAPHILQKKFAHKVTLCNYTPSMYTMLRCCSGVNTMCVTYLNLCL